MSKPRSIQHSKLLVLTLMCLLPTLTLAQAPRSRVQLPRGVRTNAAPKGNLGFVQGAATGLQTTDMTSLTPQQLVQSLLGPNVVASNIVLNGATIAAGTFTGGTGIIGFDAGVVLSSGNIGSVPGPNAADSTSTDNLLPGDPQLNTLTTTQTFDAMTLEFDFTVTGTSNQITFQYVFSSEEYNEWVNTAYNDVFGFFLNGVNIATLPGGLSVAINNVNCGNPYVASSQGTCPLFVNNSCADLPVGTFPCTGTVNTEMDGLTVVLTAVGTLAPGTNHIKLAIADAGDSVYDSNVFIRGSSFTPGPPGPFFPAGSACGETVIGSVGVPLNYGVIAQAATGMVNNSVTLDVNPTTVPQGLTHSPTLPITVVGQNMGAGTEASWTPTMSQKGTHVIQYTSTDQLNEVEDCDVTVVVAETYLLIGSQQLNVTIAGTGGRLLLTNFDLVFMPVSETSMPSWFLPNIPSLSGYHVYAQVAMHSPDLWPTAPLHMSNGLDIELGVQADDYGPQTDGLELFVIQPPLLGTLTDLHFHIN